MFGYVKKILKKTPAIHLWIWYRKHFAPATSQSNEAEILGHLVTRYQVPKSFIEFGFGTWEFNCARLTDSFEGLLLDGDSTNVRYARRVLPNTVQCEHVWLTLETLGVVERFAEGRAVGVLSVDVDGNDFWFLHRLIKINPAIIVCEFNRAFGCRPVTVPYDEKFERFEKHPSGLYFGASISAIHHLCSHHGYSLLALSSNGVNAFFIRSDLLLPDDVEFDLARHCTDANSRGGAERFEEIAALDFVDVSQLDY